mmetsp:Transcript_19315/g.46662  ORF Transcript_19315/g.46662 Transcript_19315/m.46662 type:complete len:161 (-) Transcript_19315:1959-2441(-)
MMNNTTDSDNNDNDNDNDSDDHFQWTPKTVALSVVLMVAAGVAEIIGGWMIWMTMRGTTTSDKSSTGGSTTTTTATTTSTVYKPWWWAVLGGLVLVLYGFIPTFQPTDSFGRIYAVYGGFFIVLSFVFGWILDGDRPDIGDGVGCIISLVGVCVIMFWPR